MADNSDDSDDDIPLAQRNVASSKAEPPAKVKAEPAEKRKAEAKVADPVEKKQKAAPPAKKAMPTRRALASPVPGMCPARSA